MLMRNRLPLLLLGLVTAMQGCGIMCECAGPTYTLMVRVIDATGQPLSGFDGELEIGPSRPTVSCPARGGGVNPNIRCLADGFAADLNYRPTQVIVRLEHPRPVATQVTPMFQQTADSGGCCSDQEHYAEAVVTIP